MRRFALAALLISLPQLTVASSPGEEMVGRPAHAWLGPAWHQGGPLSLEDLRGRVVLVRWWTGPHCPYCRASAPYLNQWHAAYTDRGLTIVGFYHHKASGPMRPGHVEQLVKRMGFQFPIAVDPEWRTLRKWWLDRVDHGFTSVSFLLDRDGVIRRVHAGGSYDEEEAAAIEAEIRRLLGDPGD